MSRAHIAAVAAIALLAPVSAAAAAEPGDAKRDRVERAATAVAVRSVESCARPRLTPGLAIKRTVVPVKGVTRKELRIGRAVSTVGKQAKAPARAQAIALAATLNGDLRKPVDARRFYRKLIRLRGWQVLPPTIAAHRVLGTPDPFAYEDEWGRALRVLSALAKPRVVDMGSRVAPGGSAPRRCFVRGARSSSLPLPAGTAFSVSTTAGRATGSTTPTARPSARPSARPAAADPPKAQFRASCGTPVIAVTGGIVQVSEEVAEAGPWLITVRDGSGTTTTYAHAQRPTVSDGDLVVAGQQLAEVGDFGDVDACALGLSVTQGRGPERRAVEPVRWLAAGLLEVARRNSKLHIPETTFRFATFNVLGAHLTGRGNDRPDYGPGPVRMARALGQVEAVGASVAVFNEFENPQAAVVEADGDWDLYRATANNRFRDGNMSGNAVGWRQDTWKLVDSEELVVPWSVALHMPIVTLEHLETKSRVIVMGVHNPATTPKQGNQAGARSRARALELAKLAELRDEFPTTPLIVAGDFNERAEAFCGFTGGGWLKSAAGGSIGGCSPPRFGQVDHIFGSLDLSFSGLFVGSPSKAVSDHPMVAAYVTLPAQTVDRSERRGG